MLRLLLFILILLPLSMPAEAVNDATRIKREQREAQKAIKEGKRKLETNKRELNRRMKQLNSLEKEIGARDVEIGALESQVSQIDRGIVSTTASIDSLVNELQKLRRSYSTALRRIQAVPVASSPLSFLFSAGSMNEFFDRLRHLREFNSWRRERERAISAAARELGVRQEELKSLQEQQRQSINSLNHSKALLKSKQSETDRLVVQLKKEGGEVQADIDRRQKKLASLNRELNRIIEADRRAREAQKRKAAAKKQSSKSKKKSGKGKTSTQKAATAPKAEPREQVADPDRELTGSFESNRGRLLFPVSGKYRVVRGFGRGRYSSKVQTSPVGIDIEVPSGAGVRAIFDGVVTNVSSLDGFNNIVVIRHGSYLSVYINLGTVSARSGQKVSKGQLIGTAAQSDDGSGGLLQFGLRKDRQELNPLDWVR